MFGRVFSYLAPDERLSSRALPLTLLVRPLPVLSLVVLGLNDHLLKGSGWLPEVVTGKLSDFAGLVFFPLLLVTLWNLFGHALFALRGLFKRALVQPSATSVQVVVAAVSTGLIFTAVQLHPAVARAYAAMTDALWIFSGRAQVTMDPSDLVALPMLLVAVWLGRRAVARIPPGRVPYVLYLLREVPDIPLRTQIAASWLRDVKTAAKPEAGEALAAFVKAIGEDANPDELDELLSAFRR